MLVDIVGRIRNLQLPLTQPLIPLFECLVNSLESIEDKYHQAQGCYIEIIPYDKVLNDAKKRNRAFFEQLQIPMT